MVNLFIDVEFTDLNINTKKLISVGLYCVDKQGKAHSFYVELSDTYDTNDCSEFVIETVLPLLEHKNVMGYWEMIVALGSFIEDLDDDVILISDAPTWDFTFFTKFLSDEDLRPNNLRHLAWMGSSVMVELPEMREHHALDDAIRNHLMVEAMKEAGENVIIKILTTF